MLELIFDEFWHRFRLHFGTPLASNSMFFGDRFFDEFLNQFFIVFDKSWDPNDGDGTLPFGPFSHPSSAHLYLLRTLDLQVPENTFSNF